jgi:hypothetical protein
VIKELWWTLVDFFYLSVIKIDKFFNPELDK